MSGIDRIISRLDSDCQTECDKIIAEAKQKAESIKNEARNEAELKARELEEQAKKKAENTVGLARSQAEMRERRRILSSKVELLNKVLGDALSKLENMGMEEYRSLLESLAVKNAQQGDGILLISENDAEILSEDFICSVNEKISSVGSLRLKVADKPMRKGIILAYGDIEINLTFAALIGAEEDTLKQTAQKILFK